MSDKIQNRFSSRVGPETILESAADEDVESFPSFALLRGARERAVCIELRKKSGEAIAIPYGMIHRFEFDASTSIKMYCADGLVVTMTGRNLVGPIRPGLTLFSALVRYIVPWVSETERAAALTAGSQVLVSEINW
jgi:hypothetical protein